MKLLLISLTAAGLGLSLLPSPSTEASSPAADSAQCRDRCKPGKCEVTAECTPEGTCLLEFRRPDGSRCRVELECKDDGCRVVDCDRDAESAAAPATSCCPRTGG